MHYTHAAYSALGVHMQLNDCNPSSLLNKQRPTCEEKSPVYPPARLACPALRVARHIKKTP